MDYNAVVSNFALRFIALLALFIIAAAPSGGGGGSSASLTGSQYQIPSFTATNTASGNADILTDSSNDLLVTTGALGIWTSSTANAFTLSIRDPNLGLNAAVPTFRAFTNNAVTAMDIIPHGAPSDAGYGTAWNDICNTDITNAGAGANTSCLHLGSRSSGEVDIGENTYGTGTQGPVDIVDGGNGGTEHFMAKFSYPTGTAFHYLVGFLDIYSAAGTAIPAAAAANNHYRACVSDSTACTSGTTYASGGATACEVWSNGSNWIESGSGC